MSEFMWVKLGEGRRVRNPHSQKLLLVEKVYKVKRAQFWLRRLDAGDVVACEEPSVESAEKAKPEDSSAKAAPKKKEKSGD